MSPISIKYVISRLLHFLGERAGVLAIRQSHARTVCFSVRGPKLGFHSPQNTVPRSNFIFPKESTFRIASFTFRIAPHDRLVQSHTLQPKHAPAFMSNDNQVRSGRMQASLSQSDQKFESSPVKGGGVVHKSRSPTEDCLILRAKAQANI
jgi:hypothetical protein